jgi:hypothetical protein
MSTHVDVQSDEESLPPGDDQAPEFDEPRDDADESKEPSIAPA